MCDSDYDRIFSNGLLEYIQKRVDKDCYEFSVVYMWSHFMSSAMIATNNGLLEIIHSNRDMVTFKLTNKGVAVYLFQSGEF